MEREALKMALDVLLEISPSGPTGSDIWQKQMSAIITIAKVLAQPAQEPDALTIAYQSGFYDGKQAALAKREWNFCERCGKRTKDLTVIHTCTPPQGDA
jgi:hypothetical protein